MVLPLSREERLNRGRILKDFLDNQDFKNALADIRRDIADEMIFEEDRDKRDELRQEVLALDRITGKMNQYIGDGAIAEAELKRNN